MDCGPLEDGAFCLFTATSQPMDGPEHFPHVTDGKTKVQRGQSTLPRPHSRSLAPKELSNHSSPWNPPKFLPLLITKHPFPTPPQPSAPLLSLLSPQPPEKACPPEGGCDLRLGPSADVSGREQVEAIQGGSVSHPARRPIWTGRLQSDLWARELGYFGGGTGGPGTLTGGRGVSCPCCRLES